VRIVRGHGEVRRFPSRHNHGLFRLGSYLRLRGARPEPHNGILVIDRHQSNTETWAVAIWMMLTMSCYLAVALFPAWPILLALLVGAAVAVFAVHVAIVLGGVLISPAGNALARLGLLPFRVINMFMLLPMVAASASFATRATWIRFVAWQFLGVMALNALAAVIVFLLRDSIAQLEGSMGGSASGQ
jgi:hypothetical protein